MGAVRYLARLQFGRRWATFVVVALVLGVVGGIASALVAGSRRSASVVDRYFAAGNPYALSTYSPAITQEQASALPGVVRADGFSYIPFVQQASGRNRSGPINVNAMANPVIDRTFKLFEGRYVQPGENDAVVVNQPYLDTFGGGVGDTVRLRAFENDDGEGGSGTGTPPTGPEFPFRIVGVVRSPAETILDEPRLVGNSVYESTSSMFVNVEFFDANRERIFDFGKGYLIILDDPARRPAFEAAARGLNAAAGNTELISFSDPPFGTSRPSYDTTVTTETGALLALGLALGLVTAIVIALVLRADQRVHNRERGALLAIGVTRSQLGLTAALRAFPAAAVGACGAVALAYAISDRFPIGFGRQLELDDGRSANVVVLLVAAVVIMTVVATCAFFLAYRGDARGPAARRGLLTAWLAQIGAPKESVLGSHFAFGRGESQTTVPTRPAIAGGIVAIIVAIAAGVFVNNVDALYATPAERGWTWDVVVGNPDVPFTNPETVSRLAEDPRFETSGFAAFAPVILNGRSVEALAYDVNSTAPPVATEGRMPRTATEIVLGAKLADSLGADVGSAVELLIEGSEPVKMTVVGLALPPPFGDTEMGQQAIVAVDGIEGFAPEGPAMVMATLKGDDHEAALAELAETYPDQITTDIVAARVVNLRRVRAIPRLGIALSCALGLLLLAYTLAVGVRARSRELGVLRALGISGRQLRGVLSWEGVLIGFVIVAIGLPLGVVAGNLIWRALMDNVGLEAATVFEPWILAVPVVVLLVAMACALIPARRARKATVATVLRVE
jgi:hypothetical protein